MVQRAKLPGGFVRTETRRDLAAAADELPDVLPIRPRDGRRRQITTTVPPELHKQIRDEAIRRRQSMSEFIEAACRLALRRKPAA